MKLVVHRSRPEIEVNDVRVRLAPKEQLVAVFLADRGKKAQPAFATDKEAEKSPNEYRAQLRREASANDFWDWRASDSLACELDEEEIRKSVSYFRKKLRKAGPIAMGLVPCLPEKRRFSIDLPPKQISFIR